MGRKSRLKRAAANSSVNPPAEAPSNSSVAPPVWTGWLRTRPALASLLIILALTALMTGLRLSRHYDYLVHQHGRVYADSDRPMLNNFDGYYYLRLAHDLAEGNYHGPDDLAGRARPEPVPLLVRATSAVHSATGASIEDIAFFLSPILAALLVLVFVAWGRELGGVHAVWASALAGMVNLGWIVNTDLGKFDTQCLNPVIIFLAAWALYRFVTISSAGRFIHLGLYLALTAFAFFWWQPGGLICLALVGTWALSVFWPSGTIERLLKATALFAGLSLILVYFIAPGILPKPLVFQMDYALGHLDLVLGLSAAGNQVGQSIMELNPPSMEQFVVFAGGSWPALIMASLGFILMAVFFRLQALFLAPLIALGFLGLVGLRFTIFTVPAFALGLGCFLTWATARLPLIPFRRGIVVAIAALAVSWPNASRYLAPPEIAAIGPNDYRLALELREKLPPGHPVMAWWDNGYFIQYAAKAKTLFDGGSQTPDNLFLAATALAAEDPIFAANWIQFALHRGPRGLKVVESRLGGRAEAMDFLRQAFSQPDKTHEILAERGLQTNDRMIDLLFPSGSSALWLTFSDLANDSQHLSFARTDPSQTVARRLSVALRAKTRFDPDSGTLHTSRGPILLAQSLTLSPQGSWSRKYPDQTGFPTLVDITSLPYLLMDEGGFLDSAIGKLMIPMNPEVPGFERIYLEMGLGGVWNVVPVSPSLQ
ncbi:MAG: hypothetical protein EOM25_05815 [Deltaproteobacteria bacterium]|nr:hypothetical protein [Deltaproteobacteria bacterium]